MPFPTFHKFFQATRGSQPRVAFICLALVLAWRWASYRDSLYFELSIDGHTSFIAQSKGSILVHDVGTCRRGTGIVGFRWHAPALMLETFVMADFPTTAHPYWSTVKYDLGLFWPQSYPPEVYYAIPIWLFAVPPLLFILMHYRRRYRRANDGLCPVCEYDLRASPDRCPECGTRREMRGA
jgi:hypothetical protein